MIFSLLLERQNAIKRQNCLSSRFVLCTKFLYAVAIQNTGQKRGKDADQYADRERHHGGA
jgi:hypothetical protein